ncbi:MAG: flippase [Pseudomonadota bacterium]|nr:flippase [Pseudomonadota bacterium]
MHSYIKTFLKRLSSLVDLKILLGAGISFIIKIFGAGVSFGLQVALARLLSLEDYGSFTYIMAWIGMISGFASLGFTTSLIRFIPQYLNKEEFGKLKGVIKTSLLITFSCSLLFAVFGLLLILLVPNLGNRPGYSHHTYLYAVGILFGMAFTKLFGDLEKGKKNMFMAHAPSHLFRHVFVGVGVFILWLMNSQIDVEAAILITFISIWLLVGWHLITLKYGLPNEVFISETEYQVKKWLKTSLPLLLISGFLMILNKTDVIMLGIFSTKAQVGIYNVAYKVSTVVTFILVAVNAIAAPTISELYHQGKMKELQRLATNTIHLIFWPTLLISGLLILLSDFVLGLFGGEFLAGKILLNILLVGQIISASTGCVGNFLNMTGYQNESAKIFGTVALVNIIFNPIGIYFYGAEGAAVVTTLTIIIWNVWFYISVKRKIGVNTIIFGL